MQLQAYDDMSEELDEMLERNLEAVENNADQQQVIINGMLDNVVNSYDEAYSKINDIIDKTGLNVSDSFNELNDQLNKVEESQSNTGSNSSNTSSSGSSSSSSSADDFNSMYEEELRQPENTTNRPVARIELSETSVTVQVRGSTTVSVKEIKPADAANKNVKWSSSDTSIATVSGGTIKGVAGGSCSVICSAADGSGTTATVAVTVTGVTPSASLPNIEDSSSVGSEIASPSGSGSDFEDYAPSGAKQVDSSGINSSAATSTTKSTSTTSSSSGDNKITKGEKVTFDNGKYTASNDGSGSSGKQKLGEKVYVTKISSGATRPYHISQDKSGDKPLGWVKKSQLSGYATGAKYIDEDQLAWLNEYGNLESIIRQRDGAIVRPLSSGDRILNASATENLYDLANDPTKYFAENIGLEKLIPTSALRDFGNSIQNHYDSLLTVNGNVDKDALPGLQEILQQSYKYTSKQLTMEAKKLGIRGIR